MPKKRDFSKKIIKVLSGKLAISIPELTNRMAPKDTPKKVVYAITRSLKNLREAGIVENVSSGRTNFARLTKKGKRKAYSLKLEDSTTLLDPKWDGFWRIILLDLPEERKNEREALRYLLKKAGFVCLKNSAWISPYPFEYLFMNIKKDLGLSTELMIIVTQFIDEDTLKTVSKNFRI